jgi:gluconate 2-dehydrogenase gamma chain
MSEEPHGVARRSFLKTAGASVVALPALPALGAQASAAETPAVTPAAAPPAAAAEASLPAGYQSLGLDEAAVLEALVDHMWPADELSVSGVELGIVTFIDRQLAGAYGRGDRLYLQGPFRKAKPQHGYQLPLTPEAYFRAGLSLFDRACRARYDRSFDRLSEAEREAFLQDVAGGKADDGADLSLGQWFNGLVYPLFVQGAFADPIYGGNRGKAAWRMIGYPGLPAVYGQDVVTYRGRRHPASDDPKSIQDFT